jgi:uncharacterized protein with ParB-like and HNH nuclease domain
MASDVQLHHWSIGQLFAEDRAWVIPAIQRPYCWGTTQVSQFVTDILQAFGERTAWFFGQLSLHLEADQYHILDGQQRIITATIFAHILRAFIPGPERIARNGCHIYTP